MKFQAGEKVTWLYEPRGGYCDVWPVPATVLGYTRKGLVKVAALKANGDTVVRYVHEDKLRSKGTGGDLAD